MTSPSTSPESRTIEEVQSSTRILLESFKGKLAELKGSGTDIKQFLRFGVDYSAAGSTAKKFFGKDEVEYIAIDGTDSVDQQLDLLVFYAGAFGYSGRAKFLEKEILVSEPKQLGTDFSVSTAIPISEDDAASIFGQKRCSYPSG